MRYAIITSGTVSNIAVAEADFAAEQGWIATPDGVGIGWSFANGEFTAPAPAPLPVPIEVTQAQAKIALQRAGLFAAAEAAINAAGVEAQIWWSCALTFRRDHPLIAGMASPEVLDLTEEQVDDLFRVAETIA